MFLVLWGIRLLFWDISPQKKSDYTTPWQHTGKYIKIQQ